jgi:A/G-specific adenine glycosylase
MTKYVQFTQATLDWYEKYARDLPWRKTTDPYAILVSELMLQQTQVSRVLPKYKAWMSTFPTLSVLRGAQWHAILTLWQGLGYNRRAKYLYDIAQNHMQIPLMYDELISLKGVGEYTANAVLTFSLNEPRVVIDANVKKILNRVFGVIESEYASILKKVIPQSRCRDFYNALMDIANAYYTKTCDWSTYPYKDFCKTYLGEIVAKPRTYKQSAFVGSPRYYRGQVLKKLIEGDLTRQQLEVLGREYTLAATSLVREGLLFEKGNTYTVKNAVKKTI